jgi:hypothetical protein
MDIFIHQFKLYRMANVTNFKMINPTSRVSLFLGFMEGPKVIGWAQQQAELLEHRVVGYIDDNGNFVAPTHPDNDEFLWKTCSSSSSGPLPTPPRQKTPSLTCKIAKWENVPPMNTSQSSMNSERKPIGIMITEEPSSCSNKDFQSSSIATSWDEIISPIPCLNGKNNYKRKWSEAASSKHLLELGVAEKETSALGKTSSEESWTLALS